MDWDAADARDVVQALAAHFGFGFAEAVDFLLARQLQQAQNDDGEAQPKPKCATAPATAPLATHGRHARYLAVGGGPLGPLGTLGATLAAAAEAMLESSGAPQAPEEVLASTRVRLGAAYHVAEELAAHVAQLEYARAHEVEQAVAYRARVRGQLAVLLAAREKQRAAAQQAPRTEAAAPQRTEHRPRAAAEATVRDILVQQLAREQQRVVDEAQRAKVTAQKIAQRHQEVFQLAGALQAELVAAWASEAQATRAAAHQADARARLEHVLQNEARKAQEASTAHMRRVLRTRKELLAAQAAARPPHLSRVAQWHHALLGSSTAVHAKRSLHGDPSAAAPPPPPPRRPPPPGGCGAQANSAPW